MNANIYQILWNIDKENNGCSVSKRLEDGSWDIPDADIFLDEQVKTSGNRSRDLAKRPLFYKVKESVLEKSTYRSLIKLLDNYIVNYRYEEAVPPEEKEEIDNFIAVIKETAVMKRAVEYIEGLMKRAFRDGELDEVLWRLWFDLYTNYYNGKSSHYCSGFEHVFVGEGKYDPRRGSQDVKGEVSGYHNWVKFYIDEQIRKIVDYRGYNYKIHGNDGADNPDVVTLQMTWTHTDINGDVRAMLFKKIGGFFVGTSPECEIAMGTVTFFENVYGVFGGDRRKIEINEEDYALVLYRNIKEGGGRGDHIRSYYPEYKGRDSDDDQQIGSTHAAPPAAVIKNTGPIIITRSLINPAGDDTGKEWVELKNVSAQTIDLDGWELRDKLSRPEHLSGTLDPNAVKQFIVTRSTHYSMQLGNGGGVIQMIDNVGEIISHVTYTSGDAASGQETEFPIETV